MPSGHIRKRGRLYQIILELDRHPQTQERRFRYLSGFTTKKAAQAERDRLVSSLRSGNYQEPTTLTLAGFAEQWLTSYARVSLTPHTAEKYAQALAHHIIPSLGPLPLARLSPLHIQEWVAGQLTGGRKDGRGGLSARTTRWNLALLRAVLRRAVLWGVIARNPADAVEPPRSRSPEPGVLGEAETRTILQAAMNTPLRIPLLLAFSTGMRRGEVLALEWGAVDLEGGFLRVVKSVVWRKGGVEYREPKTEKGRRSVSLPATLILALRRHRAVQVSSALAEGRPPPTFVCAAPDGSLWTPSAFYAAFRRLLREHGLDPISLHAAGRHSHATQLLARAIPLMVVSERLGHHSGSFTLAQYGHVLPGQDSRAAEEVDSILGGEG